tara:strand:- start:1668 stop:2540 length:873 start_codon:yes stop_codon:yes gene_type:complete
MRKKSKKKILITGSNGFIGFHLKKKLNFKYELITPSKNQLNLKYKLKLKKYLNKVSPDFIINLTSSTNFKKKYEIEKSNQLNNTFLTNKNLVDTINKNCKLVIFFGSIEEYGACKLPYDEKMRPKPRSLYGKYKYKAYLYTKRYMKKKKSNYIWLRPSLTFGYKDNKERYLGSIINSLAVNKKIYLSPGNQIRDYIYVSDLCRVIELLLKANDHKFNTVLNISAQNYVKLDSIPKKIEKFSNKKINYIFKKNNNQIDMMNSNEKLKKLFPKFKFSSFDNSLKKIIKQEKI